MGERAIAVVEPQMEEFFHAPFNAALLHAVALTYPGTAISFRGFASHVRVVRGILQEHAPELIARIEWREAEAPRGGSLWWRFRDGARTMREVLRTCERVLLCSVSRMQLLQLKRMMKSGDVVRAVMHGDIDALLAPSTERLPKSLFSLHRVLLRPHPLGLRYVLLSESIQANMPMEFLRGMGDVGVMEHPYHFAPMVGAGFAAGDAVVLGAFGNNGEARLLERVAREVKAMRPDVEFRVVGFVQDEAAAERLRPFVADASAVPIAREVFVQRATAVTHALWLAEPQSFRLRASGTFLDALLYGKPLMFTANAFVDPYYAMEPEIGVRCVGVEDVPAAIVALAETVSPESYAAARAAIERLRLRFTPAELAKKLPAALAWD